MVMLNHCLVKRGNFSTTDPAEVELSWLFGNRALLCTAQKIL
ncbi:hypothetical protein SETIT_2G060200v2 [Setaria italica]|uniref:Uncharacterized protein n=2 Tax=Setaria TaxID=4554 RepID=A0A368PW04_SETIT|nr:hypothetical protein SETIT_2G060200v2 [Setaria italica]TKW30826.1 hypothetical protein SEVIR_2G063600v2 [Setaria viridis]